VLKAVIELLLFTDRGVEGSPLMASMWSRVVVFNLGYAYPQGYVKLKNIYIIS
jgi:hypothetical protein